MIEPMYGKKELAKRLGLSMKTINEILAQDSIRYIKIGKLKKFTDTFVKEYIDKQTSK